MVFYHGQKVICVNDDVDISGFNVLIPGVNIILSLDGLTKGLVYTIRKCRLAHPDFLQHDQEVVDLYEIERDKCFDLLSNDLQEVGFLTVRFRPLVTKKTDISIFERILKDEDIYEKV